MALLQFRAPVDYDEHQSKLEDLHTCRNFTRNWKIHLLDDFFFENHRGF